MLDLGIDSDVWPWIWLILAVAFALIELIFVGGSFVLLPFAVSAFVAALLGFYDAPVEVQWLVFVIGGGLLFVALYRWSRRYLDDHALPPGVGADRMVGLTGTVTTDIVAGDPDLRGRVTVVGEMWGAMAKDDMSLARGTKVRITGMQGTRVIVEPIPAPGSPGTASPGGPTPPWPPGPPSPPGGAER